MTMCDFWKLLTRFCIFMGLLTICRCIVTRPDTAFFIGWAAAGAVYTFVAPIRG
jgi:hypothetical protein